MTASQNPTRRPPYRVMGFVFLLVIAAVLACVFVQFRGGFSPRILLTAEASRAGLLMDPGSKVTYNGVPVGRVTTIDRFSVGGVIKSRLTLAIDPTYIQLIPSNVDAVVDTSTLFGKKYLALTSPKNPSPQRIARADVIAVASITTEFNTLFETIVDISAHVDPIKLNQVLNATAQALAGLGDGFGRSITQGNEILAEINPQMARIRRDNELLAELADAYASAAPDLFDGLTYAETTAITLNGQRANIDQALMASIGFDTVGSDVFERSAPYLVRGTEDLISTSELLDEYSPALFCMIRNYHDVEPKSSAALGGNGYSSQALSAIMGAANPYVYPDNLPRVNARGGPEGRPGCWQPITRDLYPAPYLVMDTGASIAPYNHFGLGQPLLIEYVWGRQIGENTINP